MLIVLDVMSAALNSAIFAAARLAVAFHVHVGQIEDRLNDAREGQYRPMGPENAA